MTLYNEFTEYLENNPEVKGKVRKCGELILANDLKGVIQHLKWFWRIVPDANYMRIIHAYIIQVINKKEFNFNNYMEHLNSNPGQEHEIYNDFITKGGADYVTE